MASKKTTKKSKTKVAVSSLEQKAPKHIWLSRFALITGVLAILYLFFMLISLLVKQSPVGGYVQPAKDFIFASTTELKQTDGRTNVLLLGKGGAGHDAPELTDTIIFVSVSHASKKATLISIPRDIWIDAEQVKINHAFKYGKEKGGLEKGLADSKKIVEMIVGQPVHYATVVDFSGFSRLIDALGGIEVEVKSSFIDYKYPIAGRENDLCSGDSTFACRYETVQFTNGMQLMDGVTALKFARSRHAEGDEGTDFARAARQQQVLGGIKNKILSTGVLFNPDKIAELIAVGESSIETDIAKDEGAVIARLGFEARDSISNYVLDSELLYDPPVSRFRYQGHYVLLPKAGVDNFSQIHTFVISVLP